MTVIKTEENLENVGEILKHQRIWESLILPKGSRYEKKLSNDPVIFFILSGSVSLIINSEQEYMVCTQEMFMTQSDNSYDVTALEKTDILVCQTPMEAWYSEQKWIDGLVSDNEIIYDDIFFKLSFKKVILHYLSLINVYLEENVHFVDFFEMKRQELFYLFFIFYQKDELARFLYSILSKDVQFKKFVITNYLNAGNVQDLAKLANYSTSGFIKKFQRCFNDSPYKWMQRQKARQISFEIKRGNKSLQEIANEYKFSSYQHFYVFCKTQFGAPPTSISDKFSEKSAIFNEW